MLAVVLRTAVFLAAWTVFTSILRAVARQGQATVGLELLTFAGLAAAAAIWAAVDGRRGMPLSQLLVCWAIVAGALGIYVAVFTWMPEPGVEMEALAGDLIVVSPLIAGVTFAPAAIAGAAGAVAAVNDRTRRR